MGRHWRVATLALLAVLLPILFSAYPQDGKPNKGKAGVGKKSRLHEHVEGRLLVRFKNSTPVSERAAHVACVGKIVHEYKQRQKKADKFFDNLVVVETPHGAECNCEAAIAELRKNPNILYAEVDGIVHADNTPNDPDFNLLWAANNTGQTGGRPNADMNLPEAWNITTGSSSVIIAVIDTGVQYTHPDLAANIWTNPGEIPGNGIDDDGNGYIDDVHGWDWVNNDNDPMDDHFHGTHVSGTIAGVGNNGVGVTGVSWSSKIMPLKFLNSAGSGSVSNAVQATQYATQMGALVMNNSWSGPLYSQALQDAIDAANAAGVNFVVAAGNSNNSNPCYPAFNSGVVTVAATDHNDVKASFSNYGGQVEVAAPGVSIWSSYLGDTYAYLNGTSMACPQVAGVCALLRGQGATRAQAETLVIYSADNVDAYNPNYTGLIGNGRANAYEALVNMSDVVSPSVPSLNGATGTSGSQIALDGVGSTDDRRVSCYRLEVSADNVIFSSVGRWYHSFPMVVTDLEPSTTYYFRARAYDAAGNASGLSNVVSGVTLANSAPATPAAPVITNPMVYDPDVYSFTVSTTDPDGGLIRYTVDWGDGIVESVPSMQSGTTAYISYIWPVAGTYAIRVMATDKYGASSGWSAPLNFTVTSGSPEGNGVPTTPNVLSSTTTIRVGDLAWYTVSSTDPEGGQIKWFADGGGLFSLAGNTFVDGGQMDTFIWFDDPGTYSVRFLSKDASRGISSWSAPITVTVTPNQPPNVPAAPSGPTAVQTNTPTNYSFVTTDPEGDLVEYTIDWGDGASDVTPFVSSGSLWYLAHSWTTGGSYNVRVKARDSRGDYSGWSATITVTATANQPPVVPAAPIGPAVRSVDRQGIYSVQTTDPEGDTIEYTIDWGDATTSTYGFYASGTLLQVGHTWSAEGTYDVRVRARDSWGNISGWSPALSVFVGNVAPNIPSAPSGPASGYTGTLYTYTASATDPNDDLIKYTFDWGDGATYTTGYYTSGSTGTGYHSWNTSGTYQVKVKAIDSFGLESGWSTALVVTVTVLNSPPTTPSIPSGPTSGNTGTSYSYTTSATDPDGNQIKYTYDWGDGQTTTTGFYASGAMATASHSWSSAGTYLVKAKAIDSNNAESAYSLTLSVTITVAQPDLIMTAVSYSGTSVRRGSSFTASSTAKNQGTASAGAFVVTFRLSANTVWGDSDDIVVTATRSISSLAPGATSAGNTSITVPSNTPVGYYYVLAYADGQYVIAESNETNNSKNSTSRIQVK